MTLHVFPVIYRKTYKAHEKFFHRFSSQFQNPNYICRFPEAILSMSLCGLVIAVSDYGSYESDFTQGPKDQFQCPNCLIVYSRHKSDQGAAIQFTGIDNSLTCDCY